VKIEIDVARQGSTLSHQVPILTHNRSRAAPRGNRRRMMIRDDGLRIGRLPRARRNRQVPFSCSLSSLIRPTIVCRSRPPFGRTLVGAGRRGPPPRALSAGTATSNCAGIPEPVAVARACRFFPATQLAPIPQLIEIIILLSISCRISNFAR
jgi:hypothetical protein